MKKTPNICNPCQYKAYNINTKPCNKCDDGDRFKKKTFLQGAKEMRRSQRGY